MNRAAVLAGSIRLASGVSFLVAPEAASKVWGTEPDGSATASLLRRSMGYRDALIGALLLRAGWRDDGTAAGWFLASGGADLADLTGGVANWKALETREKVIGLGGAAVGIAVGLAGARAARRPRR